MGHRCDWRPPIMSNKPDLADAGKCVIHRGLWTIESDTFIGFRLADISENMMLDIAERIECMHTMALDDGDHRLMRHIRRLLPEHFYDGIA